MKISERKAKLYKKGQIIISENEVEFTCTEFRLSKTVDKYAKKNHCEDIRDAILLNCIKLIDARPRKKGPMPNLSNAEVALVHSNLLKTRVTPSPLSRSIAFICKVSESAASGVVSTTVIWILYHFAKPYFPSLVSLPSP